MLAKVRNRPATSRQTTGMPDIDLEPLVPRGTVPTSAPQPHAADPADPAVAGQIETESARHKFERLCVARMNRALTSIRLLGNLASSNYRWDEPDVEAIQRALVAAVSDTMTKFEKRKKVKPTFTLPPAGAAPATWHGKPEPDAET